jgi:Myb DNA-binding like
MPPHNGSPASRSGGANRQRGNSAAAERRRRRERRHHQPRFARPEPGGGGGGGGGRGAAPGDCGDVVVWVLSELCPKYHRRPQHWDANNDSKIFYDALRQVGADLNLMRSYFNDRRNRCQLKRKYQTELIKNSELGRPRIASHLQEERTGASSHACCSFSSLPFWMRPMGFQSDDLSPYTNPCVFCLCRFDGVPGDAEGRGRSAASDDSSSGRTRRGRCGCCCGRCCCRRR